MPEDYIEPRWENEAAGLPMEKGGGAPKVQEGSSEEGEHCFWRGGP